MASNTGFDENGVKFIKRGKKTFLVRKYEDGTVREFQAADNKEPVFVLPPYKVDQPSVIMPMAGEVTDWGVQMMNIPALWSQSRGKGCKVAILDTGVDAGHPDLDGAIKATKDFTNSRSGSHDSNSHGTHVAGVIAARHNNLGVVGVAYEAELYCGKVLGDDGSGSSEMIAAGIKWAIDNKVNVISMSLGSSAPTPDSYEYIKLACNAGIIVIAAAGNEGPRMGTVGYPARYPEVIAVGAIDRKRQVTSYSSRGPEVDICAPGDKILSTVPNRGYSVMSGTSMATPFVSAVVALMWAKHHKFGELAQLNNYEKVLQHLKKTAVDAGKPGYDPDYGFGLVNPEALLKAMGADNSPTMKLDVTSFTNTGLTVLKKYLQDGKIYQGSVSVEGVEKQVIIDLTAAPAAVPVGPSNPSLPPGFINPFA